MCTCSSCLNWTTLTLGASYGLCGIDRVGTGVNFWCKDYHKRTKAMPSSESAVELDVEILEAYGKNLLKTMITRWLEQRRKDGFGKDEPLLKSISYAVVTGNDKRPNLYSALIMFHRDVK